MHLHEIVFMFLKQNAWFIAPLFVLVMALVVKNNKARKFSFYVLILALCFCIVYLFNKFVGHNNVLRGLCLSFVELMCTFIQLVETFVLMNAFAFQILYSTGLLSLMYELLFAGVLTGSIDFVITYYRSVVSLGWKLKITFNKAFGYALAKEEDSKTNTFKFLQVMRV